MPVALGGHQRGDAGVLTTGNMGFAVVAGVGQQRLHRAQCVGPCLEVRHGRRDCLLVVGMLGEVPLDDQMGVGSDAGLGVDSLLEAAAGGGHGA